MSFVLPHIMNMPRYQTGLAPQPGRRAVKLNQNENPYPPSPRVSQALLSTDAELLRLYPGESINRLRSALAAFHGVSPNQVFVGNGSSEIISLIMKIFVGSGGSVAVPDPTFGLYQTAAWSQGAKAVKVPLNSRYEVDVDSLVNSRSQAAILVNPNAPTGLILDEGAVAHLAGHFRGLVVVDEAYMDFAGQQAASAAALIRERPNLIVLRTFSKAYSLSGARVGYCLGCPELIAALDKGKDIYNVNSLSAQLALAALEDRVYFRDTVDKIIRTREEYTGRFRAAGFGVLPSSANFLLCQAPGIEEPSRAVQLYEGLAKQDVYVRYFDHPRLADKLRISVGTGEEMDLMWKALLRLI